MGIRVFVFGLVAALAVLVASCGERGGKETPPAPVSVSSKILFSVPLHAQTTDYSCGAAAMLSILEYYGVDDHDEVKLIQKLGTDPKKGTDIERIEAFARKHKLGPTLRSGLTYADLEDNIRRDQPVLVEMQAWRGTRPPQKPWKEDWDNGHFVIVIGLDETNVYFADPSIDGVRGFIPRAEFLDRWHDVGPNGEGRYQTGVLFKATPVKAFKYIE